MNPCTEDMPCALRVLIIFFTGTEYSHGYCVLSRVTEESFFQGEFKLSAVQRYRKLSCELLRSVTQSKNLV